MNIRSLFRGLASFIKTSPWWTAAILIVLVVAGRLVYGTITAKSSYTFITVTRGTISQSVSVTGNTKPVTSVDLSFQNSGRVVAVNVDAGSRVYAGQTLIVLDQSDLAAQLAQAEANVENQKANLAELESGTRPEDIQTQRAEVAKDESDLSADYLAAINALNDAYTKANDAVRNQTDVLFSLPDTNPSLSFTTNDSQAKTDAETARSRTGGVLVSWQKELAALHADATSSVEAALSDTKGYLQTIRTLVDRANAALLGATSLGQSTVTSYKTNLTAARSETDTAQSGIITEIQTIATDKLTLAQAEDQLALKIAGPLPQTVQAQEAQVQQAEASAASIRAKLSTMTLSSPIDGIVSVENPKVGEIATPGETAVSIISANKLEIEADVPEVDIGEVATGNPVQITFDAFPGESFEGTVFYIDPAETVINGVVDYKIKANLNKDDPRIKSGLTANLDIQTLTKSDVLILPQYAIIQNDQGAFVKILENGILKQTPITLGIESENGNVEILSGVREGDKVINVGLKTSS